MKGPVSRDTFRRKRRHGPEARRGRLNHTMEELAAAKERAEAADHLKSAFLATMSHELRTPLNSIIGFTGIILQGYWPAERRTDQTVVHGRGSANHLLSLINDVLDISKIEAGQLQVSLIPGPAGPIEQAVESCLRQPRRKGSLSIRFLGCGHYSATRAGWNRFLNLLSNAIKFTDRGEIEIECREKGWFGDCVLADTGIGIKEEDMAKLFKAFQQVDSGTTRNTKARDWACISVRGSWNCWGGDMGHEPMERAGPSPSACPTKEQI